MTQNLLVATDFSIESLNVLKAIIKEKEHNKEVNYNVHFVIGYDRGDSIRDLLFENSTKILDKVKVDQFDEACAILKNKYDEVINKITYHVFSGYFQNSFNQFTDAKQIDEIFFSSKRLKHKDKKVFELTRFIKKSKIKKHDLLVEYPTNPHERGSLAAFFS